VEPQINTSTRNLKVRAQLEKSALNPGAFVKVMLDNRIKGIVVPTNAIIPDARSNQVVVLNKGKAEFRNVETGIRTEDLVEITNGLAIGDSIVISGTLFVRPKSDVVVRSVKKIDELIQGTKK
jgi:membrane fusion protein (multidrug efflux system)